jgi:alanyl-tRNA synthetase
MTGNEIRETFLKYFERNGHTRVRSSPLLPANDPTLLFTNAGMNQFKDVFLGLEKRDYVRACSSQKCLRAGGKHNDLDEVGKTARHQTFFEMLGNFSFGDYFKEDAIKFAWDLLVNEFKLDPARMWFSVFEGDDEVGPDEDAERFWEQVGAPRERILRFGRKDNFWQMGDTGPCGPCSEIHYYMGPDPSDPENNADNVNGPGDTITEIWNLVFMQFDRSETEPGKFKLTPLPAPSVDTGMGLERITTVLQGVKSNYETDLLKDIVEFIAGLADRKYEAETQSGFAMRVIADHARATAFAIADGILPGNEGRNYVIRKIMRRAIYQGRHTLGLNGLFFYKATNFVVDQMKDAFPELETQRDFIEKMVRLEEERFGSTMIIGLSKLSELTERYFDSTKNDARENLPKRPDSFYFDRTLVPDVSLPEIQPSRHFWRNAYAKKEESPSEGPFNTIQGAFSSSWAYEIENPSRIDQLIRDLAKLYDTFGTPRDLIYVSLNEQGFRIDEDRFNQLFDAAIQGLQEKPHVGRFKQDNVTKPAYVGLTRRSNTKSDFKGYDTTRIEETKVIGLIRGEGEVQALAEGDEGEVVLDRTPFYAESGGQVGDVGRLFGTANPPATADGTDLTATDRNDFAAAVLDTYSPAQGLIVHKVKVEKGSLKVGDTVSAEVDVEKRDATRRNHTATHLMHAALREVLGTHVKQAGSVVAPTYLRFDFNHYQPLTADETEEIERLVNYHILRNEPVQTDEMAVEEAMRSGAMALFGEKYGEKVRVLSIKGAGGEDVFSKELCGGTHVRATGDIGLFKITSDESIASGVRRIRAVTGVDAFERFREAEKILDRVAGGLRTSRTELVGQVERLQDELKKTRREADELRMKIASGAIGSASANGDESREVAGVKVVAREASGLDSAGMRQLSDTLLARIKSGVVVLGRSSEGKVSLIVRTSADLIGRVPAGKVIKELAPIVGGKGGGKPDMAEGGGSQPEKLGEALEASYAVVEKLLG